MDLSKSELSWAAGFFDAGGNLYFVSAYRGKTKVLRLIITRDDSQPLERLQAILGTGSVNKSVKQNGTIAYSYLVTGKNAVIAVSSLIPYMGNEKKKQAAISTLSEAKLFFNGAVAKQNSRKRQAMQRVFSYV